MAGQTYEPGYQSFIPPGSYFEGNTLIFRTSGFWMPGFRTAQFQDLDRHKKWQMKQLIKSGGFTMQLPGRFVDPACGTDHLKNSGQ